MDGRYLDVCSHAADLAATCLGADLVEAFSDIVYLTVFMTSLSTDSFAAEKMNRAMFGDRVFFIELILSTISVGEVEWNGKCLRQACKFAGLAYIKLVLRNLMVNIKDLHNSIVTSREAKIWRGTLS